MTEQRTFQTLQGDTVKIKDKIGGGGQGGVYRVAGQPKVVAKIFSHPAGEDLAAKLEFMCAHPTQEVQEMTAWPQAVLMDTTSHEVVGYLMPRLVDMKQLDLFLTDANREEALKIGADWRKNVRVASNLAIAFHAVHAAGHVVGDIKPANVMLGLKGKQGGTVRIVDCDSFQIAGEGRVWPAPVDTPEYLAPELQGMKNRKALARTVNHDNFALAVLIFKTLYKGAHPFAGKVVPESAPAMSLEEKIKNFRYPYADDAASRHCAPPEMYEFLPRNLLPQNILDLFSRAFTETGVEKRPGAGEWYRALHQLDQHLVRCATSEHWVSAEFQSACPWCKEEAAEEAQEPQAESLQQKSWHAEEEISADPEASVRSAPWDEELSWNDLDGEASENSGSGKDNSASAVTSNRRSTSQPAHPSSGSKWLKAGIASIIAIVVIIAISLFTDQDADPSSTQSVKSSEPLSAQSEVSSHQSPKFRDYLSVDHYQGPRAEVKLVSEQDHLMRTKLRATESEPVNFAGEYVLSMWGCGASCQTGAAVNARTGTVVHLPFSVCCWEGEGENIIFRPNSRLLVLGGLINEDGEHGTHFYELRNGSFVHLRTIPVR